MSVNTTEVSQLVTIAREVVRLIDASTITISQVPAGLTLVQLRALVNRFYNETPQNPSGHSGNHSTYNKPTNV